MTFMYKVLKTAVPAVLVVACSGCGYLFGDKGVFRDTSQDYKKAPELPVVDVPEGKDTDELHEIYAIPPIDEELVLAGEFEVPRPSPLVAGAGDETVRIQKLGDETWALVASAPGQLWPQVRSFLTAANIPVARLDARAGVMETGWLSLEDQEMGSRFRYRIEQGVQRGTSELHVLQMYQAGDIENWPEESNDKEQEAEMLRAIAQYIANTTEDAPVSMMANQAISAGGKISMQESPEGYTFIQLGLPYDRAWASLGRALTASTFEITDRDRSVGNYYANFIGPEGEDDDGWFDWLFSDDDHVLADQPFLISVTRLDEQSVSIRLQPQAEIEQWNKREEQALLALIKGNIN
jgi:outer membrane protein assembly factor BamC